ncbi:MAG: oligosaccharide flippase family protein [Coriobacteriia bacterium]|nr:oligosaccharide flippase family protein [Coriobacteriia bacterium]
MNAYIRLFRNTLFNISAYVVTGLVSFVTLPIMLRAFGQSVFGVYVISLSIAGMIALLDFGLITVLSKEVAQIAETNHDATLARLVHLALFWLIAIGVLSALVLWAIAYLPGLFSSLDESELHLLRNMLLVQAVAQLFLWPCKTANVILIGKQSFGVISLANLITALASAAIIVVVLIIGRGPVLIIALTSLMTFTVSGALLIYAVRTYHTPLSLPSGSWFIPASQNLFRIAIPLFIVQISAFLMQQQTDRLLLGLILGATAVALYEVAARIGTLVIQMVSLALSAFPPFVAHLDKHASRDEIAHFFLRTSRYLSFLVAPILLVLVVLAPQIIHLWVGDDFLTATLAMRLLTLSALYYPFLMAADSILIARDKYHLWLPFAVVAALINLALSFLLIRTYGLNGVAIATLCASLFEGFAFLFVTRNVIGFTLRAWLAEVVVPALVPSLIGAVTLGVFIYVFPITSLAMLFFYFALACVLIYSLILAFSFTPRERAQNFGHLRKHSS